MSYPALLEKMSLRCFAHIQLLCTKQTLLTALLVVTLSCSFWISVSRAVATEQRPDAPGSITGRITNQQGEPLANMIVTLYRNTLYSPWYHKRLTQTQADGYYRFSLIDAGFYRIGVTDAHQDYAPTFYPAAADLETSAALTIAGNSLTNIDMTMASAGAITGYITATALALGLSEVRLYDKLSTDSTTSWRFVAAAYLSPSYPAYQLRGLHAGRYRLCAVIFGGTAECYPNVYNIENALDLTVTAGITLSNINLEIGNPIDGAKLSGRITSVEGTSLKNIAVVARPLPTPLPDNTPTPDWLPPSPPATPTALPYPSPTPDGISINGSYYTRTTATGDYQFPVLPAGMYQLQFRDPTGNYAVTYYDNTVNEEQALPLELKERTVISNVNARLIPGARITGVLTVHGQPAQDAHVGLYQQKAAGWRFITTVQANDFSGQYMIDGLAPGVYRLTGYASVYDFVGDVGSGTNYWGAYGGNRLEEATNLTLTLGETKTAIDLNLTNGPQFNSTIIGRVTSGNSAIAGIKVALYPERGCCAMQPFVYVYSDAEGHYAIQGLSSGAFQLAFLDPAGVYARTFYKDQLVSSLADTIRVKDGETQTANVDLVHGGALGGTVRTIAGQPVPDLYVMLYIYFEDRYELLINDVQTDANGKYRLDGLHPGSYQVCFRRNLWDYTGECYGVPEGWGIPSYAVPLIRVKADQTLNDIDLLWGPDHRTYLPTIAR